MAHEIKITDKNGDHFLNTTVSLSPVAGIIRELATKIENPAYSMIIDRETAFVLLDGEVVYVPKSSEILSVEDLAMELA